MKKSKIYTLLMAVGMLTVLSSCQKQGDDPTPQPESETVDVKFNTFLKEGKNIRPFNITARSAAEGTLANGFYLYGHAHKLLFATTSGNTYTTIFDNVKINTDGTYTIPKFWLKDKSLLYSFQAYAATDNSGEVAPETPTAAGKPPYVSSGPITGQYDLYERDILGAAVFDIKMSDEVPTVNLYFEHRLAKLAIKAQRINPGGPTLYNVKIKLTYEGYYNTTVWWAPGSLVTTGTKANFTFQNYIAVTLPAGNMTPIEVDHYLLPQQVISGGINVTMTYTLEEGAISPSNPEIPLKTALPTLSLESGKQLNVVIGHVVETEQIVVQSVTLTDWVTIDKNVPEYK